MTSFCVSGRGCVGTSPEAITACRSLGRQRGYDDSKGRRNLDDFVLLCLRGKAPR
jgi:hypothetical protein